MMEWLSYHAAVALTWGWWVYLLIGLGLGAVCIAFIAGRAGIVLAVLCAIIGGDVALYAKGGEVMHATDIAEFQREKDAEQARLHEVYRNAAETQLKMQAEHQAELSVLQQERDNALSHLADDPTNSRRPLDANATEATPSVARSAWCGLGVNDASRLYAIGSHSGSTSSTTRNPFSAPGIRQLLFQHHKAPAPK